MCEVYYVEAHIVGTHIVEVHGVDAHVHGADVCERREVLVWSLVPVGLWCIPTEMVSYNGITI